MQRSTDGARYSIAVSARAAREEIFAFRYVALQIFGPPLRSYALSGDSISALRYEIGFVRSLYMRTKQGRKTQVARRMEVKL